MIFLTSNGITSEPLLKIMRTYIKVHKAALVVTADNEYKEKNYHVERLSNELRSLGLSVECFDFDTQTPLDLMDYDVVEMIGGNPYYLLYSIRQNGFSSILKEFAENRYLIGCSAGSVVITPTLNLIDIYSPKMNFIGLSDLSALNLANTQIIPHYSKFLNRYDAFEERCVKYERETCCNVIRINDGDAVIISNDIHSTIRG